MRLEDAGKGEKMDKASFKAFKVLAKSVMFILFHFY